MFSCSVCLYYLEGPEGSDDTRKTDWILLGFSLTSSVFASPVACGDSDSDLPVLLSLMSCIGFPIFRSCFTTNPVGLTEPFQNNHALTFLSVILYIAIAFRNCYVLLKHPVSSPPPIFTTSLLKVLKLFSSHEIVQGAS